PSPVPIQRMVLISTFRVRSLTPTAEAVPLPAPRRLEIARSDCGKSCLWAMPVQSDADTTKPAARSFRSGNRLSSGPSFADLHRCGMHDLCPSKLSELKRDLAGSQRHATYFWVRLLAQSLGRNSTSSVALPLAPHPFGARARKPRLPQRHRDRAPRYKRL